VGQPRFEVPAGTIDGVNTVFTVSLAYLPGSTAVWLNGVLLEPSLVDGWTESNPAAGEITLKEAPQSSGPCPDVLQVFFKDTLPDPAETVIDQICGTIVEEVSVRGCLVEDVLVGEVAPESALSGLLVCDDIPLVGLLEPEETLVGVVEVC
jgi:hypothetical protein